MITLKQGIKISSIIDKMDLEINTTKKDKNGKEFKVTQDELGASLIMQMISKLYKAENEVYSLVADMKKIEIKEAENIDIIEFIKELVKDTSAVSFFKSAVKSKVQD